MEELYRDLEYLGGRNQGSRHWHFTLGLGPACRDQAGQQLDLGYFFNRPAPDLRTIYELNRRRTAFS